jgi:hypothetical protein
MSVKRLHQEQRVNVVDRPQRGNDTVRTRFEKRPGKISHSNLPLQSADGSIACGEHDNTSPETKASYVARSKQAVIPALRIWRKNERSVTWIILISDRVYSQVDNLITPESGVSERELSRIGTHLQGALNICSFQDGGGGLHFFA